MPRYLKIILWTCLALVLALVLALAVVATFNWGYARPWLNRQASAIADRPVEVRGHLEVDWLWSGEGELAGRPEGWRGWVPWPRIVARDLVVGPLAGAADTRNLAEVASLSGVINPWALLDNVVQIRGLNIVSGKVYLARQEDGRNNWTFGKQDQPAAPSRWKVDLQTLSLQDVQAQVVDASRKLDLVIGLDTLQADGSRGGATQASKSPGAGDARDAMAQGDEEVKPAKAEAKEGEAKGDKAEEGKTAKVAIVEARDCKTQDSKDAKVARAEAKAVKAEAKAAKAEAKATKSESANGDAKKGEADTAAAGSGESSERKAAAARAQAAAASPYRISWTAKGSYNNAGVLGEGQIGAILSLRDATQPFPLQGKAAIGKTCIELDGTITRPQDLAALDINMKLSGDSMSDLLPLFNLALPVTPPYRTSGRLAAQLEGDKDVWRYEDFHGAVGQSDLGGTLEYRLGGPRPLLSGAVKSRQLRLQDLGPVVGADTSNVESDAAKRKDAATPKGKVLPAPEINTEAWNVMDASVQFTGERILRRKDLPLDNIKANIELKNKVLSFKPLNFGVAGGTLANTVTLDGSGKEIKAHVKTVARHLQLKRLFPGAESMKASFGELHGDANLRGNGRSIAQMMKTSDGELQAIVSRGTISHFLLEAAGLNVANMILLKLFGDEQITMNCFASDFAVKNGLATVRTMRLETDDTVVDVTGTINMRNETVDLSIVPDNRTLRIFTLRSPLYARGTFKNPDVGVEKGPIAARAGAAVALGVIATPFAALLPLLNMGTDEATGCAGGKNVKARDDEKKGTGAKEGKSAKEIEKERNPWPTPQG